MKNNPIIIEVDTELNELIPEFLANRIKDIAALKSYLLDSDFTKIKELGHRIKGNSGGYGFFTMGDYGNKLEQAANKQDLNTINNLITELEDHLNRIQVKYI